MTKAKYLEPVVKIKVFSDCDVLTGSSDANFWVEELLGGEGDF